jgi:hypothetical protein
MILLFCFFSFLYVYFFQGGGWNQNSQFDTIRAIVERGTTEITAFARNTGDVGVLKDRIYSNKPPGLALMGAPFYFAVYHLERRLGISTDAFWPVNINAHLVTFFTSGLPGVVLLLVLYRHFRRKEATVYESLCLVGAFGTGSLLLPYSGVMMNHLLTACLLFAAWHILSAANLRWRMALVGGLLTGMATITDWLSAPAAALFLFYVVRKRADVMVPFLIGSGLMAGVLAAHNYLSFGSMLINNQSIQSDLFKSQGQLFGILGWPEPIKLFWLTVHPFRGLFYCCPLLFLSLLSLRPFRIRQIALETSIPLLVVAYHLMFNMSFNGWTGGWGVGPRYLIASLPFLYSFSLGGFRRFPRTSYSLMIVSAGIMLCVTAVQVMIPGPNEGPPPPSNPIADSFGQLAAGKVSVSVQGMLDYVPSHSPNEEWDSYNVGELLGLPGLLSLAPISLAIVVFGFLVHSTKRDFQPVGILLHRNPVTKKRESEGVPLHPGPPSGRQRQRPSRE